MCGIFGQFSRNAKLADERELCAATNSLRHRGPDGGAWWADKHVFLGHRRLSIIDLGTGNQPMASHDSRYVISFNGEIYNYIELKCELAEAGHRFATQSDTEAILEGYRRWGVDVGGHLHGMYAFAIYDREEKSLYIARDRFGEKPLFLAESPDGLLFASEVGALCSTSELPTDIDEDALGAYLCLNYVPGTATLLAGVRRLGPGCWKLFDASGVRQGRHMYPTANPLPPMSLDEAADETGKRLDESVAVTLRSDVPVTLFLSGGIDSSLVAESAVRLGDIKTAYCLDFQEEGHSEFPMACAVGHRLGINVEGVSMGDEATSDFFDLVGHLDDPLADSSALAVWSLSRHVSQHYKVALSGDGGDELFGGYLTYRATAIHRMMTRFFPMPLRRYAAKLSATLPVTDGKVTASYKLWRFLRAAHLSSGEAHFTWNGTWLPEEAGSFLTSTAAKTEVESVLSRVADSHNLITQTDTGSLQLADAGDYLPNDILTKVDRSTMAFGLESRAPFLSGSLADLGFCLTNKHKVTPFGESKRVLRRLAEKRLGREISAARKQGFSIPVHRWLRRGALPILEETLGESALGEIAFLDTQRVRAAVDDHLGGRRQYGFELWGLMTLVAWHRKCVQRKGVERPNADLRRIDLAPAAQA